MSAAQAWVGLILIVGLIAYLIYALLNPEKF